MIRIRSACTRIEKAHQSLIDLRSPQHLCPWQLSDPFYDRGGVPAAAVDHVRDASAAQLPNRRVCREAPGATGPFRIPVDLIARILIVNQIGRSM